MLKTAEIKLEPSLKLYNGYLPTYKENVDFLLDHFKSMSKLKDLETQPSEVGWETQHTSKLWMCAFSSWFPKVGKLCVVFQTAMKPSAQVYSTAGAEPAGQAAVHWGCTLTKLTKFEVIGIQIPHQFPCFHHSLIWPNVRYKSPQKAWVPYLSCGVQILFFNFLTAAWEL